MNNILAVAFAYLLGSISFGYLAGRLLKGIDIREFGSGSSGTTNILRTLGVGPAVAVLVLDMAKGLGAVCLARLLVGAPLTVMLAGVAVIIGHNWPLYFGFRGGRGIATSIGVMLGISPQVILLALVAGLAVIAATRYVSLGSIIGSLLVPVLMVAFRLPAAYVAFGLAIALLAVYRHRPNIRRLLSGTENRLGEKVPVDKKVKQ